MKKFIAGLLVGLMVATCGSVFADSIVKNLIGKTIDGQYNVSLEGEQFTTPAIVVDGTSFLPVREFGESVGYAVYFDPEGGIKLEQRIDNSLIPNAQELSNRARIEQEQLNAEAEARNKSAVNESKIRVLKAQIEEVEYALKRLNGGNKIFINPESEEAKQATIKAKAEVAEYEQQLIELNAQLAELEAQQ